MLSRVRTKTYKSLKRKEKERRKRMKGEKKEKVPGRVSVEMQE